MSFLDRSGLGGAASKHVMGCFHRLGHNKLDSHPHQNRMGQLPTLVQCMQHTSPTYISDVEAFGPDHVEETMGYEYTMEGMSALMEALLDMRDLKRHCTAISNDICVLLSEVGRSTPHAAIKYGYETNQPPIPKRKKGTYMSAAIPILETTFSSLGGVSKLF